MLFTIFAYIIMGSLLLGFVALLVFYVLYAIEVATDKKFVIQEEVSKPAPEVDSRAIDAYFGDTSPHDTPVPKPKKSIRLVPKTEADTAPNDLWLWYAATHD
jgi:hypothetical protein